MASTIDPARRAQLNSIRLAAVVDDHGATGTDSTGALGAGAALLTTDGVAWALLADLPDRGPDRQLGAALAWAVRHDATAVRVIAESGTGALARRAAWFVLPVHISRLDGRELVAADPEPLPVAAAVSDAHRALTELIVAGGATPVEESGVLSGEVDGLEVCRVIDDPTTGEVRLEVGVGAHDRETFQLLHGDRPKVEALSDVVRSVIEHRRVRDAQHPLKQLAASRRLRAQLIDAPDVVGLTMLAPADPPLPRNNVKDQVPCAAIDHSTGTLVVCTTGIDLDVVPWAGDAAARHGADHCIIAAPERDVIDVQQRLAALLRVRARFLAV